MGKDDPTIGLTQAKKQVAEQFVGMYGIYAVEGNDRVVVRSTKPLSDRIVEQIMRFAGNFCVTVFDTPKKPAPTANPTP